MILKKNLNVRIGKWKILVKGKPKKTETNGIYFPFDQISSVCACHWKQTETVSIGILP